MARRSVCYGPFDATQGGRRWQATVGAWLAAARRLEPGAWTLDAAAGLYLQHRAATGCSAGFAAREFYRLSVWLRWALAQSMETAGQFDELAAREFLRWCREEQHHTPKTVLTFRQMLYAFADFLCHLGALTANPVESITVPVPQSVCVERVLSVYELNLLVEALGRRADQAHGIWGWRYRRDLLMCKVLIATGLRSSELSELRCCDFDPVAGTLTVAGKGSGPFAIQGRRVFVCDPRLMQELRSWDEDRADRRQSLFPPCPDAPVGRALTSGSVHRLVNAWATLAGLDRRVHPHLFRHSFCSHLIANGADVYSVQQLMGHRRVEVTLKVYLHLSEDEVREQWQRHTPLATASY